MRLVLEPSPPLAGAIVFCHGVAAVSAALVLPGLAGQLLGLALLALGTAAAWSRALLRSAGSIRAIELRGPAEAILEHRSGDRAEARIGPRRYVGRFLVTLQLPRRTILVTRDMLDAEAFRRLRIWALWGRIPAVAAKQLAA